MDKKLTVIVAAYNVEKYIEQCMDSLVSIPGEEYEILAINDGSNDSTGEILETYRDNEKVKIIHKENGGVSSVRNLGIEMATGEYILFVDGDDWIYSPNGLMMLLKDTLEARPDISCGGFRYSGGENSGKEFCEIPKGSYKGKNLLLSSLESGKIGGALWMRLYKREFLLKNILKFNELQNINEDYPFNIKAYYLAEKILGTEHVFYSYRINPESITNEKEVSLDRRDRKVLSYLCTSEDLIDFFKERNENSKVIKKEIFRIYIEIFSSIYRFKGDRKKVFRIMKEKKLTAKISPYVIGGKNRFYYQLIKISPELFYRFKYWIREQKEKKRKNSD